MRTIYQLSAVVLAAGVHAMPAPAALPPAACSALDKVVSVLKLVQATPYCSQLLGVKPTTSVITVTPTSVSTETAFNPTVTVNTETKVETKTEYKVEATSTRIIATAYSPTITQTSVTTVTPTQTVSVISAGGAPIAKRDAVEKRAATIKAPAALAAFATSALSSACSCLSIPTPTVLSTSTANAQVQKTTITIPTTISTATQVTTVLTLASTLVVDGTTTVPTTITTTKTETAPAATETYVICDESNLNSRTGVANSPPYYWTYQNDITSKGDCCKRCWTTQNCMDAGWYDGNTCAIGTIAQLTGNPATPMCPNGKAGLLPGGQTNGVTAIRGPCY